MYPPLPSDVFTLPQLASVGFSEAVARDKGLDFDTRFDKTAGWYSSLRVGARHTAYKVLIEKGTGTILGAHLIGRSEEHTSELQSLMRISYAVFCLKKKK